MSQLLELPDRVYSALLKAAKANGQTPVTWIEEKLPKGPAALTPEEREAALARLWRHSVSVDSAVGIDNEQIDADLAAEYGSDHSPPPLKETGS